MEWFSALPHANGKLNIEFFRILVQIFTEKHSTATFSWTSEKVIIYKHDEIYMIKNLH